MNTFEYHVPWEDLYGFSQALQVGDTIYVAGQFAHDADGTFIGEGDFGTQIEAALANLDKVLAHFGASRRQVVETTVLVVGLRDHFDAAAAAHSRYFGTHRPTSTISGVVALALPQQLVEIGAVVRTDSL
ncbi:RidA family protein [Actinoplanes sp. TBRC 11911]|uniref:Rid family hydrolase n=1 Tax=Actinoplanes sp. TBRC 11911 TaxID=2729386 RepID=UPI00145DC297|nr:Rid family hydrolase [Actinoplanes sp. TBRC 11911]NMO52864.1 RidA family protein [Actinoplanes sp. TBRC 11911]